MGYRLLARSALRALGLFVGLGVLNLALRLPELRDFTTFVNDDSALVLGSRDVAESPGLLEMFVTSYGPNVIRPLQLAGMYFEHGALGWSAFQGYLATLAWLTLAQTVLVLAMRKRWGLLGGLVAAIQAGVSMIAAEPLYWLSDRHDVYLFFFSAATLWVLGDLLLPAVREGRRGSLVAGHVLLVLALWGGLYSNEKGVALPLLVVVLAAADLDLHAPVARPATWRYLAVAAVSAACLAAYFWLRTAVLGAAIGGYDNRILPAAGVSPGLVGSWLVNLAMIPARQPMADDVAVAALVQASIVAAAATWVATRSLLPGRARARWWVSFVVLLVLVASLPTARFIGGAAFSGLSNSRMLWLPHLVLSAVLGALFATLLRATSWERGRVVASLAVAAFLATTAFGGRQGLQAFAKVHPYNREVLRVFGQHCTCASLRAPQTRGLPTVLRGVNAYTERVWPDFHARLALGLPECPDRAGTETCEVEFRPYGDDLLSFVAHRTSRSILDAAEVPYPDAAPRYDITWWPEVWDLPGRTVSRSSVAWVKGWIYETATRAPVDRLAVRIDGRLVALTEPGIRRPDIPPGNRRAVTGNYGLEIPIALSDLEPGKHQVSLLAFKRAAGGRPARALELTRAEFEVQ